MPATPKGAPFKLRCLQLPVESSVVANRDFMHLAGYRDDALCCHVRQLIRHASVSDDVAQMEAESYAGRLADFETRCLDWRRNISVWLLRLVSIRAWRSVLSFLLSAA